MKKRVAWNRGICHLSIEARKRIAHASRQRIIENGHPKGMLGKKHSESTKRKIARWIPTEDQKRRMVNYGANHPTWLGHNIIKKCKICGETLEIRPYELTKYCSYECLGASKKKQKNRCLDCKKTLSRKDVLRCGVCNGKTKTGPNAPSWKGGITPKNKLIRSGSRLLKWRQKVFKRDKFTCQICGEIGGKLNAHHIKVFARFPKDRFKIKNGVTLCEADHKKLHSKNKGMSIINLDKSQSK